MKLWLLFWKKNKNKNKQNVRNIIVFSKHVHILTSYFHIIFSQYIESTTHYLDYHILWYYCTSVILLFKLSNSDFTVCFHVIYQFKSYLGTFYFHNVMWHTHYWIMFWSVVYVYYTEWRSASSCLLSCINSSTTNQISCQVFTMCKFCSIKCWFIFFNSLFLVSKVQNFI